MKKANRNMHLWRQRTMKILEEVVSEDRYIYKYMIQ